MSRFTEIHATPRKAFVMYRLAHPFPSIQFFARYSWSAESKLALPCPRA